MFSWSPWRHHSSDSAAFLQRPQEALFYTKLHPTPLTLLSRSLITLENVAIFCSIFLYRFSWRTFSKLPSVSQNSRWKHLRLDLKHGAVQTESGLCFHRHQLAATSLVMLRKCTLCGPLAFSPSILSQWVLQCASWWQQDWEETALAAAVWPEKTERAPMSNIPSIYLSFHEEMEQGEQGTNVWSDWPLLQARCAASSFWTSWCGRWRLQSHAFCHHPLSAGSPSSLGLTLPV